jgi:hypothetical protein
VRVSEYRTLSPPIDLKSLRVTSAYKITAVAVILCSVGWSLLWAQALSILDLVPQWLCAASFFGGIALIPVCRMLADKQSESGS